jgi:hypothetical protein
MLVYKTGFVPLSYLEREPAAGNSLRLIADRRHLLAADGDLEPPKPRMQRAAQFYFP